ncbi:MAG: hypothetical protein FWC26_14765, partial [Fibromonadales bacterium]|nr:hypothetical protein [Fibromonadales bacterium]
MSRSENGNLGLMVNSLKQHFQKNCKKDLTICKKDSIFVVEMEKFYGKTEHSTIEAYSNTALCCNCF